MKLNHKEKKLVNVAEASNTKEVEEKWSLLFCDSFVF